MRRSGSSSCLLRPKSEIDLTQMGEPMSVTMINTHQLPNYSTERFYMLSELEIKAHSTLFLCDYQEDEETQDTAESSISEEHAPFPSKHTTMPSHAILYLLWRPDQTSSVRAFADGHILAAIQHYNSLVETMSGSSHLYLVVDIVAIHPNKDDDDDTDGAKQKRHFQVAVHTCETLCRHVAQSFRCLLEGITVGISNHVRAAPGLDACVDAISVGARDRRQFVSRDEKSPVGLVALHPHDLLGLEHESSEQVTDAVQGVLQSQTCAEWNGNGNLVTFARRAHSAWCVAHHVTEHKSSTSCTRKERKRRNVLDDGDVSLAQPGKAFCILFLFGLLASHLWQKYEDSMLDNTTNVPPDELDTTWETSDP